MKKPSNATAIELRINDKELNEKFNKLPEQYKWEWLIYSCKNEPYNSLNYARELVNRHGH